MYIKNKISMAIGIMYKARQHLNKQALVNPIRSGIFQTANDPGGGGALKALPPTISKTLVSIFTISYISVHFTRCFRHVPIRIYQKFSILTILQRFQNKK